MSRNSTTPYTLKTPNIKHSVAATQIPKFAGSIIYSKSVLSLETIIFVKDHLHLGNPNSINLGRWRVNEKG
jgi:hypothetical protein